MVRRHAVMQNEGSVSLSLPDTPHISVRNSVPMRH